MISAVELLAVAIAINPLSPMATEMGFVGAAGVQVKQLEVEPNFKAF